MKRGLKFIEIVLGGVILVLVIVLIIFNPEARGPKKNNMIRENHLVVLSNAIDEAGLGSEISDGVHIFSSEDLDVCSDLVPEFLSEMPVDPLGDFESCENYDTGYSVERLESGEMRFRAMKAELGKTILLVR